MIDLHMHSIHSDGTDTTIELLKKAEKLRLEVIAITDHDKVDAHIELENINVKDYYSGILIKGVELKSTYKSIPIEILGYGINAKKMKDLIVNQTNSQEKIQPKYLEYIKNIARKIGLKFDENVQIDEQHIYASATFANGIYKTEENKDIIEKYSIGLDGASFYRNCQSNPNNIFYIDESKDIISAKTVIEQIHEAGGLAFLAHPLIYPFENIWETIETFIKEYKIDGLECYYSLFSDKDTKRLVEICEKYNLYKSGGSDYHGSNKIDINMGTGKGNLNISKEVTKDWLVKII